VSRKTGSVRVVSYLMVLRYTPRRNYKMESDDDDVP
jgi:hypothetical protein